MLYRFVSGCFLMVAFGMIATATAATIDFESIDEFTLANEDCQRAGTYGGYFTTDGALCFGYDGVDPDYGFYYWGGYAVSNRTVVAGDDTLHQYTAVPGVDASGVAGGSYGIGYADATTGIGAMINFIEVQDVAGACFTNVKWTAEWIDGNYDATDYYEIVVTGYDGNLDAVGSVTIDMTDNVDWEWQSLGFKDVYALGITMQSSDDWTPTYFCIDNISEVPEPGMLAMLVYAYVTLLAIRRRG